MNLEHSKNIVINLILLTLVVSLFLVVNIYGFDKKKKLSNQPTTTNTTTTKIPEKDNTYEDTIYIDQESITIYVTDFISHLGVSLKYEESLFDIKHLSNGSLLITSKEDANNYIQIERLQENDYYSSYEELNLKEETIDNYLINYKFLKGNSYNYYKITKSVSLDNTDIDVRMNYIINSLSFAS